MMRLPFQLKRLRFLAIGGLGLLMAVAIALGPLSLPAPATTDPSDLAATEQAAPGTDPLAAGRTYYQAGQFAAAIEQWQTAVQQASRQGDLVRQIMGWNSIASAQQVLNHWDQAHQAVEHSRALLETSDRAEPILWAQTLNTQANLALTHGGQAQTALELWQAAETYYRQAGDTVGALGAQINQTQAWQTLGFYRRAEQQLQTLTQQLNTMPDNELKISALRSLGQVLQRIGSPQESYDVLAQSLEIALNLDAQPELSSIFLSIGKLATRVESPQAALDYFQAAEDAALNPLDQLQARLDKLATYIDLEIDLEDTTVIPQLTAQIQKQLTTLPASRTTVYSVVNFAHSLSRLPPGHQPLAKTQINQLLVQGVNAAKTLNDQRAEAYALYQLGQLYRHNQQPHDALTLTQQSLTLAESIQSADIISQAAWQLGNLLEQQGKLQPSIDAYTKSVDALQSLRGDLLAINQDVQFSYREQVEPVYRDLVSQLLREGSQDSLKKARVVLENLQIAELDNFFRAACIDLESDKVDQIDPNATVIYAIVLDDRLAVIYSQPDQSLQAYETPIEAATLNTTLRSFLASLHPSTDRRQQLNYAQTLYDWLIRPAEVAGLLQPDQTLVFVLDGLLRNLPMAALHDGQRYLIEKYAVALSPGLQLLPAKALTQQNTRAIVAGISQARGNFMALPAVKEEVNSISKLFPSSRLLDQQFTRQALRNGLSDQRVNILHLASHGQFSSDFSQTFFLTWDGAMNINELSELLKQRETNQSEAIELLTLSACETATGDDRAWLGLAGLAVRSGARSTLATLWSVKDEVAKQLMTDVYTNLGQAGMTKAKALRQAQLELLNSKDFADPFFWSAYVLIGNWL
ncbi:CHAT domain-containing protein [Leptothoe sp. PORK10 BA2]|uniref:CHAT domain-containing protein n=1 Tax=Leptothoe sp. PORK10 BA2 TaxID=3110254 RepID=UPI002B209C22|nr:CHAT domain-containing protein [Leptothoe sp. PORK10 BA2]MEA5465377.1 CHAT domain-containing protein [Leptothoe sp. PORK10 BA2]